MIFFHQNVTMSESGEYRCSAGNVLGETSSSIHLQINRSERTGLDPWTVLSLILVYVMAAKWAHCTLCGQPKSKVLVFSLALTWVGVFWGTWDFGFSIMTYLLPPEDGAGCDPPALHADLHPVPPDCPPDHCGHPVPVTTNNVIQILL